MPIQPPTQTIDDVVPMAVQPTSSTVEEDIVVDIEADNGRNETAAVTTSEIPSSNSTTCTASKAYMICIGLILIVTVIILGVVLGTTGSSNYDSVNNSNVGGVDAEDTMVSSDTMQMEGDNQEVETVLQNDDDNNDCSLTDLSGEITTFGQNLGSTIDDKNGGGVCYRVTFGTYGTFDHGYDTIDPTCKDYKPRLTIGTYYRSEGGGIISYYTGGSDLYACDSYGGRSGIVKLIFDESITQVVVTAGEVSSCRYEMIITTPNCEVLRNHLKLTSSIESTSSSPFELSEAEELPSCVTANDARMSTLNTGWECYSGGTLPEYFAQCTTSCGCRGSPGDSPWCCGDNSTDVCMNNTCVPVCPNTSNQLDHMLPDISLEEEDSCTISKAEVLDTLNTLADGYTNFPQYEYADGSIYEYSVVFFRDNEGVLSGQFYQHEGSWWTASYSLGTFNGKDSIVGNRIFFSDGDIDGCSKPRQAIVTFLSCQCGGEEEGGDDHANVLAVERSTELPWLEASVVVTEPESCVYEMTVKSKCGPKAPFGSEEVVDESSLPPFADCVTKQDQVIKLTADVCLRDQMIGQSECQECLSSCDYISSGSTFSLKRGKFYSFTIKKDESSLDGIWLNLIHNTDDIYMSLYKGTFCDGLVCQTSRDGRGCSGMQTGVLDDGDYILFIHGDDHSATYNLDFTFKQEGMPKWPDMCNGLPTRPPLIPSNTTLEVQDEINNCSLTDLSGEITIFEQNLGSTIVNDDGIGGFCYRVTFGTYGTFDHGYDTIDPTCTDYKPRLTIGTYYRSEGGGIISYYTGGSDLYACDSYGGRSGIVKLIFDKSITQVVVTAGEVSSCRYEMIITTPNCEVLRNHLKLTSSIESTSSSPFELTEETGEEELLSCATANDARMSTLNTGWQCYSGGTLLEYLAQCTTSCGCRGSPGDSPWCCGDNSTNVCMNNTCVPVCPNTSNQLDHMLPDISLEEEDSCALSKAEVLDTLNILADGYTGLPQYEYLGSKYMYTVAFFRDTVGVLRGQFKQYEGSWWSLGTFNGEDSIVGNQIFFSGGDIDGCRKPRQATVTFLCQCGSEEEEVDDHANVLAVERSAELPWSSVVVTEPEGCVYEMTITSKCQPKTPFGDSNGDTGEDDEDEVDEHSSLPPFADCAAKQEQAIKLTADVCLREQMIGINSCQECPSSCDHISSGSTFSLKRGQYYSFTINKEETGLVGIWLNLIHNTDDIYMSLYKGTFCDGLVCETSRDGRSCGGLQTGVLDDGDYILFIHGDDHSATYNLDFTFKQEGMPMQPGMCNELPTRPSLIPSNTTSEVQDDINNCSLTDLSGEVTIFEQNLGSTIVNDDGIGGFCYRVTFGTYSTFDHGFDTVDASCKDYKPRLTIGTYYRSEVGGIISYYTGGSDLYACDSYGGRSGIVKLIFDKSITQVVVTAGEVSSCRYEMIIMTPNCEVLRNHLKPTSSIEPTSSSPFESTEEIAVDTSIFSVSSNRVSEQADHESICKTEFGSEWKVADWEYDIKAMEEDNIIQLMNLLGIFPINSDLDIADTRWYDGYFVTNNGNKYYGPRGVRVYNFHYISGGAPSWFLVHDSYANDLFLGSWYDMERYVLCKKTATVNEIGSSGSTTLAIERASDTPWEEGEGRLVI